MSDNGTGSAAPADMGASGATTSQDTINKNPSQGGKRKTMDHYTGSVAESISKAE